MSTDNETPDSTADTDAEVDTQEVDTDDGADEESDAESFDADKVREKIRKTNSENRNLRKRAADAEAKAKESEGSTERVTALEAENLRLRIGLKHGLHPDLVNRLNGSTEDELLEDAEKLLELFGGKKPPTNQPREKLRGGGDPTQQVGNDLDDLDKFAEDVFRR